VLRAQLWIRCASPMIRVLASNHTPPPSDQRRPCGAAGSPGSFR
jgi:hypothetical protein